jgi:hypothetical protein
MRKQVAVMMVMMILSLPHCWALKTLPPQVGASLPDMKIQKPADSAGLKYLGLSGSGTFSADQVKATGFD